MSARPRSCLLFLPTTVCRPNQVPGITSQRMSVPAAFLRLLPPLVPLWIRSCLPPTSIPLTSAASHQISTALVGTSLAVHFAKVGQAGVWPTLPSPIYPIIARVSAVRVSISEIGADMYGRLFDKTATASTSTLKRASFPASAPAGKRVVPTAGGDES